VAFCPNCGAAFVQYVQAPQVKRRGPLGRVVLFLLIGFGVLFVIGILSNSNDSSSSAGSSSPGSSTASSNPPSTTPASTAPTEANLKDVGYLSGHYEISAEAACEVGADDYLKQTAKYDFAWDKIGMLESKFDSYATTVKSPGILTMLTDKVKLQNGFGAYERVILNCDYDTQAPDSSGNVSYSIVLPSGDE
jgi:hypothetical protein